MPDRYRSCAKGPPGRPSNRRRSSTGCGACLAVAPAGGPAIWRAPAPRRTSGDADELKLDVKRFPIEGFHHIFVGARFEGCANMRHVILGVAEHDLRLIAVAALAKQSEELHPAHYRHVPVEEDDV